MKPIRAFNGLNNVADPLRLGLAWLKTADNCDITQTGALRRRDGYSLALAANPSGAYATIDETRCYLLDAGTLKQVGTGMVAVTLKTGLADLPMYWTEINDQVFYTNGTDSGIILKDGAVRDWAWTVPTMPELVAVTGTLAAGTYQVLCTFILPDGRETGSSDAATIYLDGAQSIQINAIPQVAGLDTQVYIAPADSTVFQLAFETASTSASWNNGPDALGTDLTTQGFDPLPVGCTYLATWRGQIYAAQYIPQSDSTVVWASEALGFHLFSMNVGFILVPGKVSMLAAHDAGLIVGTDTRISVYDGETLVTVADYGIIPGWSQAVDDDVSKTVYFWTQRGVCRGLPFENITKNHLSVAPGIQSGAAIVRKNGEKQYVVALHRGGAAFNQRSQS